jgi:hypothetical protein
VFLSTDESGICLRGATTAVENDDAWWVHFVITIDREWRTRSAEVWSRSTVGAAHVRVDGDGTGHWTVDGVRRRELDGCLDVDLESSACTNTLPVHRIQLRCGSAAKAPAAWVRLDASVERLEQSYRRMEDDHARQVYAYESPALDFAARLTFDEHGLVVAYPGIAIRVL